MPQVLIIDDEQGILDTLQNAFSLGGIDAQICSDPLDALALHREKLFPVILTDIRMPGMTGVELLREIKKIHPTCIAFIMTGYSSFSNLVECLELGAADYFTKPFDDIDFILNTVNEALLRQKRWKLDLIKASRTE